MSAAKTNITLMVFGLAALAFGISPAAAQSEDNCKAPQVQQSPDSKTSSEPQSDMTGSTSLSNCNGVIKPAETGDNTLVQPAPPASNMPVVRPKDLPTQQQNAN